MGQARHAMAVKRVIEAAAWLAALFGFIALHNQMAAAPRLAA